MRHSRTPFRAFPTKRVRAVVLFALGALCVLGVGIRLAANAVARWQTRTQLNRLHGITADFLDARLSFFPLVYTVTHLKLSQLERQTKEPLLYANELSLRLLWGPLLTGHLTARIQGVGLKVVLEQPAPGKSARLPGLAELIPTPVFLERLQAKESEVLYVWVHQKGRPTMWFHDIEATLENLGSRPNLSSGWMTLAASGIVQRSGRMSVVVQAKPFAEPFTFRGDASLDDFDVSQMNALIDSQKGVKLSPGNFSLKMNFNCKDGQLEGRVEPTLRGSGVEAEEANLGSAFIALFGRISMAVSTQPDGTTGTGAILVRDELVEPNRQLLLSMEKVVENGFLLGLQESLRRIYAGKPSANVQPAGKRTELKTGK